LIVPCHRVIAAGGKLGGFSAPQGLDLKRRLLSLESTPVDRLQSRSSARR
jgi:methylated-DNA-[protein]-cysteine S-methyltransferase